MKAPVLGLAIAALAFGASTIYLALQLREERTQADQVAEQVSGLNARIAELEKTRAERRFAGPNPVDVMPMGPGAVPPRAMTRVPPPASADKPDDGANTGETVVMHSPPRSEAWAKMMRSQIRASNRHLYADVGTELGLTKDEANKLIDLISDQQTQDFGGAGEMMDPAQRGARFEELRHENKAAIIDLIGAAGADALEEYQQSLPSRQELAMLSGQFEGTDSALTADQSKRLLAVLVEERKRVPMPTTFGGSTTQEEAMKSFGDWQADYNERVATQARGILTSPQLKAFDDYQQWQKEMRDQVAKMRPVRMPRGAAGATYNFATTAVAGEAVLVQPAEAAETPRKEK
jgi:outer membrane murein-binding lipoprotein Lpp